MPYLLNKLSWTPLILTCFLSIPLSAQIRIDLGYPVWNRQYEQEAIGTNIYLGMAYSSSVNDWVSLEAGLDYQYRGVIQKEFNDFTFQSQFTSVSVIGELEQQLIGGHLGLNLGKTFGNHRISIQQSVNYYRRFTIQFLSTESEEVLGSVTKLVRKRKMNPQSVFGSTSQLRYAYHIKKHSIQLWAAWQYLPFDEFFTEESSSGPDPVISLTEYERIIAKYDKSVQGRAWKMEQFILGISYAYRFNGPTKSTEKENNEGL